MDNHRIILFGALAIVLMLIYDAWQAQFHPPAPQPVVKEIAKPMDSDTPAVGGGSDTPQPQQKLQPLNPPSETAASPAKGTAAATSGEAVASTSSAPAAPKSRRIRVNTDLLHVELDSKGADIRKVTLKKYPVKISEPNNALVLFNDELPELMITQSGFIANSGETVNHARFFQIEQDNYELKEGEDSLSLSFVWSGANGQELRKVYTFHRNQYLIDLKVELRNASNQDWRGQLYRQIKRNEPEKKSRFIYTYTGAVVSGKEEVYEKVQFDDMKDWHPESPNIQGGWVAMLQHYFLGAIIPGKEDYNKFYTQVSPSGGQNYYIVGLLGNEINVTPGNQTSISTSYYIGPKEQDRLHHAAPNLRLTVDYGVLTVLARPLYWVLDKFFDWFGNWGVAIILVTLMVKLIFFKLSEKSYRSMANMRKFQPKIQALKERYGNDKQRFSQAMMELYRKEKINPLGGCLPMLVQIPVFISLYWVLLESVELRQAPFIFWIHDLSAKDPFYVLPLLMGLSMWGQQKLNPAPVDPIQQKVFQILPIFFTVFMAWFPSGLVLYWVVNNVLGMAQQWYITRKIEAQ